MLRNSKSLVKHKIGILLLRFSGTHVTRFLSGDPSVNVANRYAEELLHMGDVVCSFVERIDGCLSMSILVDTSEVTHE